MAQRRTEQLQAYYTKPRVAEAIAAALVRVFGRWGEAHVLDLCAGAGALSAAVRAHIPRGMAHAHFTLVEPDTQAAHELQRRLPHAQCYESTAEEWARTWARPLGFDVTVCNPPFGARVGRTALDEFARELHLPHIERFEDYLLQLAASVTRHALAFILPTSWLRNPASDETLELLAAEGWNLHQAWELPLDGFEGATVQTTLHLFLRGRPGTASDQWHALRALIEREGHLPTLFAKVEHVSVSHAHGRQLHGYLMPTSSQLNDAPWPTLPAHPIAARPGALSQPTPQPLGALWTRQGCVYALTERGWEPASCEGYDAGVPTDEGLERALRAVALLKQGALHCARHLCAALDLGALRERFGHLPRSSALGLLPTGRRIDDALALDLGALGGCVALDARDVHLLRIPEDVERLDGWLLRRDALDPGTVAMLWLELGERAPQWLCERVEAQLAHHHLPSSRLDLRAAWLPRRIVARWLDLRLDARGLYTLPAYHSGPRMVGRLLGYLNWYKDGSRVRAGQHEEYEALRERFAVEANDWADRARHTLRLELHARYLASHRQALSVRPLPERTTAAGALHPWQEEDLGLMLGGEALLCWDVGLGKTLGALNAAAQHTGQALICVPKETLAKWIREHERFFPQVRWDVLGFRRHAKTGEWCTDYKRLDAHARRCFFTPGALPQVIFTTYEGMQRLMVHEEQYRHYDRQVALDQLGHGGEGLDERAGKQLRKRFELMCWRAAQRNFHHHADTPLAFDDLPLGGLLVVIDEAHNYKSLHAMTTGGWGQQLVMAGSCGESKRARDLKIKLDLVRQRGGKTLGLTATPVTNSVAEIFNMLAIFAPSTLERRGLRTVGQLIDTYCVREDFTGVNLSGNLVKGQTIAGFQHLDDFTTLWNSCASVRTAADVALPLPEVEEHLVELEPPPKLNAFLQAQREQLFGEQTTRPQRNSKQVHVFTLISNMDKAAVLPALVGLSGETPKIDALIERVQAHRAHGGQLIFCDHTEAQEHIKQRLCALGIPAERVQVFNASTVPNAQARLDVQDAFNSGALELVIGGKMMSEGVDLQRRCAAIHMLNLAWEAQTIHQRKGRGVRQGNTRGRVDIYYYLMRGTTDPYRMATSQNKKHWWEVMRLAQTERVSEDVFSAPIDEGLISSLAPDPQQCLAQLRHERMVQESARTSRQLTQLAARALPQLAPNRRRAAQSVLASYERRMRALPCVEQDTIDALISRLHELAEAFGQLAANKGWSFQHALDRGASMLLAPGAALTSWRQYISCEVASTPADDPHASETMRAVLAFGQPAPWRTASPNAHIWPTTFGPAVEHSHGEQGVQHTAHHGARILTLRFDERPTAPT
ncbi:MAG: methyltransferase, partial [Myxococcales bacterium]|nr:methyltransferase [Myxococcales bacterium]